MALSPPLLQLTVENKEGMSARAKMMAAVEEQVRHRGANPHAGFLQFYRSVHLRDGTPVARVLAKMRKEEIKDALTYIADRYYKLFKQRCRDGFLKENKIQYIELSRYYFLCVKAAEWIPLVERYYTDRLDRNRTSNTKRRRTN